MTGGNKVAVRSRFTATDDGIGWGSPMGASATGKLFSAESNDVIAIGDDGMFTEHYGVFDVMGMMGQLGLLPPPPDDHDH